VATKSLIFFEALNVLFGGASGHDYIFEFGVGGGARVGVAEASLKLMDKVEERIKGEIGDVGLGRSLFVLGSCRTQSISDL